MPPSRTSRFGAIIIGDEILRGKREDKHFAKLRQLLARRGFALSWCLYLGDDPEQIIASLRATFAQADVTVFCFGGIGATPDDYTRQCAARAAGVELHRHPDAVSEIEAQYGASAYPLRVLMAELPLSSTIIPNAFNRVPGFSLRSHHFLPGFPEMAWPMVEWLLDTNYSASAARCESERAILVLGAYESLLLDLMNCCVSGFPEAKLFSLPTVGRADRRIELGVRGDPEAVERAIDYLKQGVTELGFAWREAAAAGDLD
ncbi:MAG: competence/damage-inducible protein A [Burkholderiales bacterium]|nr:competence/damage-inducible protein A [Burkholderiales bacterium]